MQVSSLLSDQAGRTSKKHHPKTVSFELLLDERSKTRARIPLRVLVNPHDTTESIITTVKNFYGIYDGNEVCFEDATGATIIASFDNLKHDTTVYVRSVLPASQPSSFANNSHPNTNHHDPQRRPSLGEPFQIMPPHLREQSLSPSRPSSRLTQKRSVSPQHGRGRRSQSQQKPAAYAESRGSSVNGSVQDDHEYSDSEAGRSSVSGSRKARSEQFASSEISTANVLLDGRRGQPIFDSSTLPLFAPTQVPVTASHEGPSPFQLPAQKLHNITAPPMLSPRSVDQYNKTHAAQEGDMGLDSLSSAPQHGHRLRDRSSTQAGPGLTRGMIPTGHGVLPTPDPTVASCISDEDVARTLIALGDASNFSHGRTSNSTIDDTFSGVADAASSTGATSDSDEYSGSERGHLRYQNSVEHDDNEDDETDGIVKSEFDEDDGPPKTKKIKTKQHDGPSTSWRGPSMGVKSSKSSKVRSFSTMKQSKPHSAAGHKHPSINVPQPARKGSNSSLSAQLPLTAEEEDLSSKPRCQRCRKSKKGCDRQRPCGRCKDAGIGIEGCVSEDEGNGKKGRYGRHMGVSVKKAAELTSYPDSDISQALFESTEGMVGELSPDKSKKRKR